MGTEPKNSGLTEQGATAVITHRVCNDKHDSYESWLNEIGPVCKSYPGHLDLQIIRPIASLTSTYTVIIRFDTAEHLHDWIYSLDRKRLIDKVRPLLAKDDDFFIRTGLDFWFAPEGARAKVPVRWKQFLITWSAIYPLVLSVPFSLIQLLHRIGVPQNRYLITLIASGIIVFLMVYIIMPRYTRLVQRWLFD